MLKRIDGPACLLFVFLIVYLVWNLVWRPFLVGNTAFGLAAILLTALVLFSRKGQKQIQTDPLPR